jgi:hypothetical protein
MDNLIMRTGMKIAPPESRETRFAKLTETNIEHVRQDAFEMINSDDTTERKIAENLTELRLKTKSPEPYIDSEEEQVLRYDPTKVSENNDGEKEIKPEAIKHYHRVDNHLINEDEQKRSIYTTTYDREGSDSATLKKFSVEYNDDYSGNSTEVQKHEITDDGKIDYEHRYFKEGIEKPSSKFNVDTNIGHRDNTDIGWKKVNANIGHRDNSDDSLIPSTELEVDTDWNISHYSI